MPKSFKFDSKKAVSFKLVFRSQQDPLINCDEAPQNVLVETTKKNKKEEHKYGIYYDDNYDYMQHLKDVKESDDRYYLEKIDVKTGIKKNDEKNEEKEEINQDENLRMPSSLFASEIQESVGMLNKGVLPSGPQLDWDPDIINALYDDDIDLEDENNILDDDFVLQAQGSDLLNDDNELDRPSVRFKNSINNFEYSDDEEDEYDRFTYKTLGADSKFTEYSMTSSVLARTKGLNDLDQQFEDFFVKDYADDLAIGALPLETIKEEEGNDELLEKLVEDNNKDKKSIYHTDIPKENILSLAKLQLDEEDNEETEEIELYEGMGKNDNDDRWDCETVLTTCSNLYNHPKLICESRKSKININKKTGIPEGVLDSGLTESKLKQLNSFNTKQNHDEQTIRSVTSFISQISVRDKNENSEEKKCRKKVLKEYMKERRMEKKANKLAFKQEHLRQQKEFVSNRTSNLMKM